MNQLSSKSICSGWQSCTCCGIHFRLLIQPHGLPTISGRSLAQQRAYQRANCGQMACSECVKTGCHCRCKTNAWVARSVFIRKRTAMGGMPMGDIGEISEHSKAVLISAPGLQDRRH